MPEPTGTIIVSLGKALVELLRTKAGFAEGDIVLKSPVEADQAGKISLFLYQVQENPHLRNRELEPIHDSDLRPPPLTLDLYYLVTPLSGRPGQQYVLAGILVAVGIVLFLITMVINRRLGVHDAGITDPTHLADAPE